MKTLFETLARNRPEWLAQGLLVRALETEPNVRALFLQVLCLALPAASVPEVTEEVPTDSGWRADVSILWPEGTRKRIELKLLAGFTPRQREALRARKVDAVVALSADGAPQEAGKTPVLTWAQVAHEAQEPTLKALLKEVGTRSAWVLEKLSEAALREELTGFAGRDPSARWGQMYRFLSTVHEHLLAAAPGRYRASDAWTPVRRGGASYYGFCFYLGEEDVDTPRFWLGFWLRDGTPVFGVSVPSTKNEPVLYVSPDGHGASPTTLDASECADRVLTAAEKFLSSPLEE